MLVTCNSGFANQAKHHKSIVYICGQGLNTDIKQRTCFNNSKSLLFICFKYRDDFSHYHIEGEQTNKI